MKVLILLAGVLFSLSSCSKTEVILDSNGQTTMDEQFHKITALPSISVQQIAFDMLSPIDKSNLWKSKFVNYLKSSNLNDKQRGFVSGLINQLNPKLFDESTEDSKIFQINTIDKLIEKGQLLFSQTELFDLLFNLNNNKSTSVTPNVMEQPMVCYCAIGSKYTCGRATGWISVEYGDCSDRNCTMTNSGCGGFWASSCDGKKCSYN